VNSAATEFMKHTPTYELYQRLAPRPEDFGRLLDKIGESMRGDFDYSEEMRGLQVPTMLVCADAEMVQPSHYVEAFKLLDAHYDLFASPLFVAVVLDFLDGQQSQG
jgi:hypothetical protein